MKEITDFNISASALGAFDSCPLMWAHAYLWKTERMQRSTRFLDLGITFHVLIETFYRNYKKIKWKKIWLLRNFEFFYNRHVKQSDRRKDDIEKGRQYLENLYGILERNDWLHPPLFLNNKSGLECWFKFWYLGHEKYRIKAIGKIDLILKRQDEICVIDWKTGLSKEFQVNDIYDSAQLILYSAAMKKEFEVDEEKLFLVYFFTDTVKEFIIDNNHFIHLKKKINHFLDVYDTGKFKKKPGKHCDFCDFKYLCKKKVLDQI